MYRTIVYIGFLGIAFCLIGCDAIPSGGDAEFLGESTAVTGKFFAATTDEFATARAVTVEADSVTVMPRTVLVPKDLWENEPEKAALVLDASAITVTMTDALSKRAQLTAKGTERHAMMIVHIAPPNHEPCGSESVVGPFDMTIADGVVTLTNVSQPLDAAARSAVRNGRFEICAETWADFDGVISIENAGFEFGTMPANEERVVVCHIPPGNTGNAHTITIAASAVPAHLAHGDHLGECEGPDNDAADDDGDGVRNDIDVCPETPDGAEVDEFGCEIIATDADGDGIVDDADACPETAPDATVDDVGCSCSQRDADADGVNDCDDACPDSDPGAAVINTGCAEENPSDDPSDGCYVDYDYTVIGNDGHSLYLDGEYIDGAGFGHDLGGTLRLSPGEHTLDVLLYNSVAGGAVLFGNNIDGVWTVASEHPRITLRAEDGTPDAWSVYRKLDCGYHSPFDFVPRIDSFETTFWMTVPERGAGLWNTNDVSTDHWIIWDDYGSTVVFPQSFWICHTTLIVTGIEDDDGDGVCNDIDVCPETAPDATVDDVGCTCSQLGNCDSDGDGVLDAADTCPDTPEGELPNDQGCSCSQIAPCDDGDACTADACNAGACIFIPVLCEGGVCVDGTCFGYPLSAWGYNHAAQINVPSGTFTAIAGGWGHSLAMRTDGTLVGWGYNSEGQTNVPAGTFIAVAADDNQSLGIRSDGTLAGWGDNGFGQTNVPAGTFTAVAAGYPHSLAIRSDGTLAGWGYNGNGEINVPTGTFTAVDAGEYHSLAIRSDGTLAGWGYNGYGQIDVPAGTFTAIAAGFHYSLAIRSDGTLVGWGRNDRGQTDVPAGTFTVVAAGAFHGLAIRSDGTLVAWGSNDEGQTNVPAGRFTTVAAGNLHSLAISSDPAPPVP